MNRNVLRQLAVLLSTVFALAVNAAANALPLNGRNTAEISDSFNVLFVPAGYVFSIWGLIYVGLVAYTIYQALPSQRENPRLQRTGWLVTLSSLANGTWIFFWHYGYYELTLATMLVLLAALIIVYLRLDIGRAKFTAIEKWVVSVPFSLYLGWITVATIANVTAVLSYLGWKGGGVSPVAWTVALLAVGVLLAAVNAYFRSDVAYLLVLVWAFAGISVRWLSHPVLSVAGFTAAGLVLVLLAASRLGMVRKSPKSPAARST
jgi:benzodiazapine receptor